MDDLAALQNVPLFQAMDEKALHELRRLMQPCSFIAGQVVIREGEPGDSFHIITQGSVQFLTLDAAGKELTLDEAEAGGWFGELSMLTGDPRSARVRASTNVRTLSLDREQFQNFLCTHPKAAIEVLSVIGKRLARADELLRKSASRNVNEMMEQKSTTWQKIADNIAAISASQPFVLGHMAWFGVWMIVNMILKDKGFDPYPFGLLTMIVSLEAIFLSIFVLISQNRSGEKDRLSADIDHQVNMKAEQQTMLLLARLDDLERGMHSLHAEHRTMLNNKIGQPAR